MSLTILLEVRGFGKKFKRLVPASDESSEEDCVYMGTISKFCMTIALVSLPFAGASASVKTYTFEDGKDKESIKIDVPKKWQDAQDLYGVPLFLLGPESDGARPTLAVTPTGISDLVFDENGLEKTQNEYKKGREEWLKNNGGTSVSYLPYKTEKWGNIDVAHTIGYRYKLGGKEYVEKSYYVFCKKKLYHMKSLMTAGSAKELARTMDDTIRSFSCMETAAKATGKGKGN